MHSAIAFSASDVALVKMTKIWKNRTELGGEIKQNPGKNFMLFIGP